VKFIFASGEWLVRVQEISLLKKRGPQTSRPPLPDERYKDQN
jgi:hypothetical protein